MRTTRLCPGSGWAALRSAIDRAPDTSLFYFPLLFILIPLPDPPASHDMIWILVAGAPARKYHIGFQMSLYANPHLGSPPKGWYKGS